MNLRINFIGKLCLLAMLASMQPQLSAAKAKKNNKHHKTSSSHSSSSKSTDKDCCKETLHGLHEIEKKLGCDEAHVICSVPAVIDKPGKWCISKDLVYHGSTPAINITVSNVTLNFNNHSLTLTNAAAIGVYAKGQKEITILNDIIKSSSISTNPLSSAFEFVNCEKVTLDNIFTANTFHGLNLVNCHDVFVTHSRFKDHIGGTDGSGAASSIRAEGSSAVVIEESTFSGAGAGYYQGSGSVKIAFIGGTACRISNCEFESVESAITTNGIDGLIVEDCVMQTAPGSVLNPENPITRFLSLIQLDSDAEGKYSSNVSVRNCLLNGNLVFSPDSVSASYQTPIAIFQANAVLIDNCQIANFSMILDFENFPNGGLIFIFNTEGLPRPYEITIKDCLVKGDGLAGFQNGITVGNADNVLVEGCTVTGTTFGIRPGIGTRNMTIRDCTVQGTLHCSIIFGTSDGETDGVTIANNHLMNPGFNSIQVTKIDSEGLHKNVIIEGNTISNAYASGIYFGETENGVARNNIVDTVGNAGIIANNAANTTIQDNTVLHAGSNGIQIAGIDFPTTNSQVLGNAVSSSGGQGILIADAINTTAQDNTVTDSGEFGIAVAAFDFEATDTLLQGNTVSGSGFSGILLQDAVNTTVQGNSSDYNGFDGEGGLAAGIVVATSTKTSLIDNSCIGNTEGGIEIVAGSTDTYVQNNTTTQNGVVGIVDDDNTGDVIAFFNKSCDNGVNNCVNVPLAQAPGDNTYIFGSNLCCDDPDAPTAKVGAKKAFGLIAPAPIVPNPTGAPQAEVAPDDIEIPRFKLGS